MKSASATVAGIFIIESLDFREEANDMNEGKTLARHLELANLPYKYVYLRTKQELAKVLDQYVKSRYRYLHVSCHGNESQLALTLDELDFNEMSRLFGPVLGRRRLFLSTCHAANHELATAVFKAAPDCFSVTGPADEIGFADATILWASFYHLMLSKERTRMKHTDIRATLRSLSNLFQVPLNLFVNSSGRAKQFEYLPASKQ